MFEGITWGEVGLFFVCLVTFSLIAGFIDAAHEQHKREKEREENRKWQLK